MDSERFHLKLSLTLLKQASMFIRLFPLIIFISFAESCVSQAADRGRPANQSTEAKQLTTKQELAINSIAKKHRNGNVNLQMIKKEIQSQTILSSVSVQSALGQVMTKIQEDAEKDVEYASINAHSATDRKDS